MRKSVRHKEGRPSGEEKAFSWSHPVSLTRRHALALSVLLGFFLFFFPSLFLGRVTLSRRLGLSDRRTQHPKVSFHLRPLVSRASRLTSSPSWVQGQGFAVISSARLGRLSCQHRGVKTIHQRLRHGLCVSETGSQTRAKRKQ